ncbi:MAG: hypothetical protein V3S14_06300 [Anaerolineae bacterium]
MLKPTTNPLAYYAGPGPMTDPGEYANLFDNLPTEIPSANDMTVLGRIAALTVAIADGDGALPEVRTLSPTCWGCSASECVRAKNPNKFGTPIR